MIYDADTFLICQRNVYFLSTMYPLIAYSNTIAIN